MIPNEADAPEGGVGRAVHDLRLKCLGAALAGSHANLNFDLVIVRAAAFEHYVRTGKPLPLAPDNSIQGQLTRAFSSLGASVDGDLDV